MTEIAPGRSRCGAAPGSIKSAPLATLAARLSLAGADHPLSLAATPTFAIMASLTGIYGGSTPDMLCAAAGNSLPLSGMFSMYVLMSVFHLGPWLKLISR